MWVLKIYEFNSPNICIMKSFMIKTANRIINLCTRKGGIKMSKSLYVCIINEERLC